MDYVHKDAGPPAVLAINILFAIILSILFTFIYYFFFYFILLVLLVTHPVIWVVGKFVSELVTKLRDWSYEEDEKL